MAGKVNKNKAITNAQKYIKKGQLEKAVRAYQKIVEEDPLDVRVWLKIGDLQSKQNKKQEAVDTYIKVAEFYSEQGFYLKAVAVFKQILTLDADQVEVNLRLAELYKQLGLLNDAMRQYEKVSSHYHSVGRMREALAALYQIVELDPKNVASRIKLAELYSREGMKDEAIQEFSRAADFLRNEGRTNEFIKVAERLVYHQPDNVLVIKELAGIYLEKRDPRRALQKLQMAFKVDPRDVETMEMLANSFHTLGQVPKTVSVLKELARIYEENGEKAKQASIFKRVLALDPNDQEVQKELRGGKVKSSPPPLPRQAKSHPPTRVPSRPPTPLPVTEEPSLLEDISLEAVRILTEVEVYIKYGLHDKAVDHLSKVLQDDPGNLEVRRKLRDVYLEMGRPHDASMQMYEAALPRVNTERGLATECLNDALGLFPDNRAARSLLGQLETAAAEEKVVPLPLPARPPVPPRPEPPAPPLAAADEEEEDDRDDTAVTRREEISGVEEDLEEAEFFMQQSLFSEARAILEELQTRFPDNPLVLSKLEELDQVDEEGSTHVDRAVPGGSGARRAADLAADLAAEVAAGPAEAPAQETAHVTVADVVRECRQESGEPVSDEDAETHYDLGIAYREMGLVDEAINAFKLASRSQKKRAQCHMMLGLIQLDRGNPAEAINQFKQGLYVEGISTQETISLYYELGLVHENQNDSREALYYYDKVAKQDPRFRDVTRRISRLSAGA